MKVEKSKMSNRERNHKRKFAREDLPQVKELESLKLNQCIALLLREEDKGLQ